jgi:hypothetical protein
MKEDLKIPVVSLKIFRRLCMSAGFCLLLNISTSNLFAQTDSSKAEAPAVAEEPSLIAPAIDFVTVQKSDNTIDLKANVKAKIKGSFIKLPLLKVTFLLISDTAEQVLGFVITDENGKAVFNAKAATLKTDKDGKLHLKAVFAGNKQMESADGEVTIKRARLEITPVKEDSLLTVKVKLIDLGTGTETPVPEVVLGVFVHRMFNPLKLGEGTTDATGEATVEVQNNLPGDAKGNITLMAKLDENELYGNMEASVVQPWGTKVSDQVSALPRALWSPHPPIWMVVTFTILMVVVWGHYIVIVVQLFRLRKEEPHVKSNTTGSLV